MINGLVDAWVSLKRLERLIDIPIECLDDHLPRLRREADGRGETAGKVPDVFRASTTTSSSSSISSRRFSGPPIVEFQSARLEWTDKEEDFKLGEVSLKIFPGQIVGRSYW